MSAKNRLSGLSRVALLSLALTAAAALGASRPAAAEESYVFGLVQRTPTVHLALPGATSEAQLIARLQRDGYADIKVTPLSPNIFDPRPELFHVDLTVSSPSDPRAQGTPVHDGWNGTAVKGGRTFEVYVDETVH